MWVQHVSGWSWTDSAAAAALLATLCWCLVWVVHFLRNMRGPVPTFSRDERLLPVVVRALWTVSVPALLCAYGVHSGLSAASLPQPEFLFVPLPIAGAASAAGTLVVAWVFWCVYLRISAPASTSGSEPVGP